MPVPVPATVFTAIDGKTVHITAGKRDSSCMSSLEIDRVCYEPKCPLFLKDPLLLGSELEDRVSSSDYVKKSFPNIEHEPMVFLKRLSEKKSHSPLKVGVAFCGRQSPGGHNVIAGLYKYLQAANPKSVLYGFIGGTAGLFSNNHVVITSDALTPFMNQGGYDLLGRAADHIRDEEQEQVATTCTNLQLDGLVLIGSIYTNTDGAHLAEFFSMMSVKTSVVVVPADDSRDMKSKLVETTLGFDTVCRTYSQMIGNLCTDGNSAKKYYYFIRLTGRKSDYTALECALQTHPNMVLLSEEVRRNHTTLQGIVSDITDLVCKRNSVQGKDFGVILIPEGLVEAISELRHLIEELNVLLNQGLTEKDAILQLSPWNHALYDTLPTIIQQQLIISRESRGTIQLSQISTEKLLAELVKKELSIRKKAGAYSGVFTPVSFFFGYKARSALPTNFDCDLGYSLGRTAAALVGQGVTGCLANVYNLAKPVAEWKASGIPLTTFMSSMPDSHQRAFIKPLALDVNEEPYEMYLHEKETWMLNDDYVNPGPIQYQSNGSQLNTLCLLRESSDYIEAVSAVRACLQKLLQRCKPGCSSELIHVTRANIESLLSVVSVLRMKE